MNVTAPLVTEGASEAPVTPEDGGPRLYGVVDVVKGNRIAGWVIDRRDPRAAVEVESPAMAALSPPFVPTVRAATSSVRV